jgi:hypothetical protein
MKLIITESELRQAAVDWLKAKYNVEAKPEQLKPLMNTEGQYEDAVTTQIGYELDGVVFSFCCETCGATKSG